MRRILKSGIGPAFQPQVAWPRQHAAQPRDRQRGAGASGGSVSSCSLRRPMARMRPSPRSVVRNNGGTSRRGPRRCGPGGRATSSETSWKPCPARPGATAPPRTRRRAMRPRRGGGLIGPAPAGRMRAVHRCPLARASPARRVGPGHGRHPRRTQGGPAWLGRSGHASAVPETHDRRSFLSGLTGCGAPGLPRA